MDLRRSVRGAGSDSLPPHQRADQVLERLVSRDPPLEDHPTCARDHEARARGLWALQLADQRPMRSVENHEFRDVGLDDHETACVHVARQASTCRQERAMRAMGPGWQRDGGKQTTQAGM